MSQNNDPRIPLNYRGVSLLSCVYKLYPSILNEPLYYYWETFGLLADEQNGFLKEELVLTTYSLSAIVHARIQEGRPTSCFIDFHKAFDCRNHDLLNFILLKSGIDGTFYSALKVLYQTPVH